MAKKKKRSRRPEILEGEILTAANPLTTELVIPPYPTPSQALPATPATATALPAVWACVDMIAGTALQVPLTLQSQRERQPLPEWLRRPERFNDGAATLAEIIEALTVGQALHGAGYLYATPLGALQWQLVPVEPDRVAVEFTMERERAYRLDGKLVPLARRFTTRPNRAGLVAVPHRTLPGVPAGVGPIQAARYSLGSAIEAEQYGSDVFGDGVPAGVLSTSQEITPATGKRYKDEWMAGARDPVRVLGNGFTFSALKLNPRDAAWLDARRFNGEEIARLFLVPAYKLNLTVSGGLTYNNPESLERDFIRSCIAGYLHPTELALNALTPSGRNAEEESALIFDFSGLLRATTSERYASYQNALTAGWLTVDEVRALESLPPMPAGQSSTSPAV